MLIGFTQRSQTVSEGALPAGHNFQWLTIDVVTSRTSEKLHIVLFHVLESSTTAIVGSNNTVNNEFLDAVFGNDDTKENYTLNPGEDSIPSLITAVRNDFRPEPLEYYTISMSTTDIVGVREHFMCNDEENATEYFCHHTIYIENDDGKCNCIIER